jgi:hypothetical protein
VLFLGAVQSDAPLGVTLMPDAHAIVGLPFTPLSFAGVARRTAFRTAAWTGAATAAAASTAAVSQQQAAQQQAAAATPAPPPAAPPPPAVASAQPLPIGTIVQSLPAGCVSTPVGGVHYFYCGGNFYRAAFSGSNLVYVTAKP